MQRGQGGPADDFVVVVAANPAIAICGVRTS